MPPQHRPWSRVFLWAMIITAVMVLASAIINPLLGRVVQWDWVAIIAPLAFVVLVAAFRRGWV